MKKYLGIILGAFSISGAQAVTVANCPPALKASLGELSVDKSLEKIFEDEAFTDWVSDEVPEELEDAIEAALSSAKQMTEVERSFDLTRAKNGRCRYAKWGTNEKIELYSKDGVDKLLFQTELLPADKTGGILLRAYAELSAYSKTKIELKGESAALAFAIPRTNYTDYSAGGPVVFVGKAKKTKLIVP